MTPERERDIERICQTALERAVGERPAFLAEACGGDEGLRREVELLLAHEGPAGSFLETPALAIAAHGMESDGLALAAGRQIGAYTILSSLGAGGMGEVYRARDATLGREVAIKVLPTIFTSDPERLARFEREARMLASLNHPNIATIHGVEHVDGIHALILEVVEGETLEERIARAGGPKGPPMTVAEALAIARQIADALEAAHEKGIVHRDLKPANIKIRPDGVVKVLDFGLAKAVGPEDGPHAANLSQSRPRTVGRTREGVLLGTAAYMSPEQARGQPVDKRTDIWAFGSVLYEMLTGRRAFDGATSSDVIASVLEREPDFHALPANTPPLVGRLLRRCLEKDTRRRLRDIADAGMDLENIPEASPTGVTVSSRSSSRALRGRLVVAVALVAIVAVVLVATWISQPANDRAPRQFVLLPPEGGSFGSGPGDRTPAFALSPDGQRLAFVATVGTNRRVWIRSLESLEAAPLNGTEGATEFSPPCWSPDGASIAFFAGGKLKKVSVQGGTPVTLADASNGQGLTWNRDGSIVFAPSPNDALLRVSDIGGTPVPATRLAAGDLGHVGPQFLPDGRHFLYFVRAVSPRKGIYAGSIDTLDETRVRPTREKALFATPGYLLFLEEGRLMAQPFDARRLELSGDPVPVTDSVAYINTDGRASFDVSPNGTLAYRISGIRTASQPVWVDRSGKVIGTAGEPGDYSSARLSPDGNRLAVELHDLRTGTGDLWIIDLVRKSNTRFTFDRMHNTLAVWSPDGRDLVFTGRPDGGRNLHMKGVDGSTPDTLLMARGVDRFARDWSRDRRYILFDEGPSDLQRDMWTLQMPDRTPKPFLRTEFSERHGRFSPNGRWVAYVSNETGRDEVYVRAFPEATGKVQISSNGARGPRWNPNGTELFFVDANNVVQAVSVKAGDGLAPGVPKPLFTLFGADRLVENWFTTDGERFFIVPTPPGSIQTAPPITVVKDWTALLSTGL